VGEAHVLPHAGEHVCHERRATAHL
jgi:hypothetical protein